MKVKRAAVLFLVVVLMCSVLTACRSKDGIVIASKQYTENIIMGEIYAQLIEAKTDIPVTRKLNLGDAYVLIPAMEQGEVDIYFEYTGTAYNQVLEHELQPGMTADEVLEICRKELDELHGITIFEPVGFNNTYGLALTVERANELGVSKISDLSALSPELVFGAGHTFYNRENDGYPGVTATYDLNFEEAVKMDYNLLYEAAYRDEIDVIVVFGTDANLMRYDMTVLEDDKAIFPPYHGAPVCLNETLEEYPELNEVLNLLVGKISDEVAQDLNYQVDVNQRPVEEVAAEFLKNVGLV